MRALLDTDVILDLLLDRKPFADTAAELWKANQAGQFEGYISAITPVNVFYIARKLKGAITARRVVKELLMGLRVCDLDQVMLQAAVTLPMTDYEDAVQHASASAHHLDALVTRNLDDYRSATLPIFSPADFLAEIKKQAAGEPSQDKES